MPTIAEAVGANLDRLVAQEQRTARPGGAPAVYSRTDFRTTRTASGKPGRYVNLQTGEDVSRRQYQKLIGRPLPQRTRAQARARVVQRVQQRGLTVQRFSGLIRQPSGRDRRQVRDRQMRDATEIDPQDLGPMLDAWARGEEQLAGDVFNDAFLGAWWNGGSGLIEDVDQLEFGYGEAEE